MLRFLTAGESHGPALTVIVDGLPAGRSRGPRRHRRRPAPPPGRLRPRRPHEDRDRRRRGALRRPPRPDARQPGHPAHPQPGPRELGGRDVARPAAGRGQAAPRAQAPAARATPTSRARSSTCTDDLRNVLERASARETTSRVAAGAPGQGAPGAPSASRCAATSLRIGDAALPRRAPSPGRAWPRSRRARCAAPTPEAAAAMIAEIDAAKKAGDTVGGVFEVVARGVPPGAGLVRAVGPPARRPPGPGPDVDPGREGGRRWAPASRPARRRAPRFHDEILLRRRAAACTGGSNRAGRAGGRRHQRRGAARAGGGQAHPDAADAAALDRPADQGAAERPPSSAATPASCPRRAWSARRWWPGCWRTRCSRSSAATRLAELLDHLEATRAPLARVPRRAATEPSRRRLAYALSPGHGAATHREVRPPGAARAVRARSTEIDGDDPARCVDDMVETMYAAPGHRPGRAPDRRAPARHRGRPVRGRGPGQLIKLVNPEFVEQEGEQRHEEGCLSVPGLRRLARAARRASW